MKKTKFVAELLSDYRDGSVYLPKGTQGSVIDAIQGNSVLVKFDSVTEPILLWYELVKVFKP